MSFLERSTAQHSTAEYQSQGRGTTVGGLRLAAARVLAPLAGEWLPLSSILSGIVTTSVLGGGYPAPRAIPRQLHFFWHGGNRRIRSRCARGYCQVTKRSCSSASHLSSQMPISRYATDVQARNFQNSNFCDVHTTTPCLKCRMRSGGSTR